MGKKNTGLKVVVGLLALAFGASVTYSAVPAVKEWTDGIIDKIVVRPSEDVSSEEPSSEAPSEDLSEEPVLAQQLELVFKSEINDQEHNLPVIFNQFSFSDGETTISNDDSFIYLVYLNLKRQQPNRDVELDVGVETTVLSLKFYEEDSISIILYSDGITQEFTSDELIINGWEPGRYDFSDVEIVSQEQILEPVYTPIYVEG